jgi:hypothetical protein
MQAQLGDVRAVGYGFSSYFQPYDTKNKDATLLKGKKGEFESAYAGKLYGNGPFTKPELEVYLETTYSTIEGKKTDLLTSFQQAGRLDTGRLTDKYVRIIRIHVFDKTINPYPLTTSLLQNSVKPGDGSTIRSELLSDKFKSVINGGFDALPEDIKKLLVKDKDKGVKPIEDLVSNDKIKKFISKTMPSIIYGSNASTIVSLDVRTQQDQLLGAHQMSANNSGRPQVTQPNGGGTGGLPLRVIPTSVSMTTLGNPLFDYMQLYFIDCSTGTTIDNVYGITGLTHTISQGKFESKADLAFNDSYGKFESVDTLLKEVLKLKVPE